MSQAARVWRAALRRSPVALLAAAGAAGSATAFARVFARRLPLRMLLGGSFTLLAFALLLSVVACAAVCAREIAAVGRGSDRERPLAPLRAAFVVVVLSWAAFLVLVHPAEKLWIEAWVGLAFGGVGLALLFEVPFRRMPARVRRTVDIAAFSLCAAAVGVEMALRVISELRPTPLLARFGDLPEEVIRRMRMAPGQVQLGFACNSAGHYDDEFVKRSGGEHLVVTIGDSFSVGVVPHDYHFTTVCERILGFPIDNMGIAATGPPEYLRLLVDEALPLDPDLVVIDVFVGNDLVLGSPPGNGSVTFLRDWLDRDNTLLWLVPKRMRKMAEERRLLGRRGRVAEIPGMEVLGRRVEDPAVTAKNLPWLADPMLEIGSFSVVNFRAGEASRARENCTAGPEELRNFFGALLAMKSAASSTPICVLLIPDEFQVEDAVWNDVLEDTRGTSLDRDHPQRVLLPWFAEHGIEVLDLLPILRQVPLLADGRRHLYHLRDTHFNARGNRAAGEALAKFLEPRISAIGTR